MWQIHGFVISPDLLVAILALFVAVVSFVVAVVSLVIAQRTLKDSEESWKQQKWFDLYAKADEAYDTYERYCTYKSLLPHPEAHLGHIEAWNDLMFLTRRVYTMAMVFPKHPAIDKLVEATNFRTPADALEEGRRKRFFDAVQDMREMAVLDPSVLEIRERTRR
jgi:hypothetical protein